MWLKAADEFKDKPSRINEQWQTVREAGVYDILRILKSRAGAGITCPPFWMIIPAM
jgi:hypothetical protein